MKNFDLNEMRVCELNAKDLQKVEGGLLWEVALAFIGGALLGGLIYDVAKYAAIESTEALISRASKDTYVPYADVGHR